MKNILMISESYPPVNGAEALLACRFSRVLESFGWSITVLTVNYQSSLHKADHRLAPFIPKKSKIVTTGNLHRWLPRQGMVEKIIRNTFLFLGLPTWDSLWYPSAMKTGTKLLKENR